MASKLCERWFARSSCRSFCGSLSVEQLSPRTLSHPLPKQVFPAAMPPPGSLARCASSAGSSFCPTPQAQRWKSLYLPHPGVAGWPPHLLSPKLKGANLADTETPKAPSNALSKSHFFFAVGMYEYFLAFWRKMSSHSVLEADPVGTK